MIGMKRLAARARSRRGESISEVLVALLVSALAILMLASMTSASTKLIRDSQSRIDAFVLAENALVDQSGEGEAADVGLTRGLCDNDMSIPVRYYVNTAGTETVVSYKG